MQVVQEQETSSNRILARFMQSLLANSWYVQRPVVLLVQASPGACITALAKAAKPSIQRLHLRNLFVSGRRYQLYPHGEGFTITTTSKLLWRYRRRTSASAVLFAEVTEVGQEITRIRIRAHIKLFYLLDVFLIPTFTASIVVFMPWHPAIIVGVLLVLYVLSWLGHRFNAALEANEMLFFVERALEDFVPAEIFSLASSASDVVQSNHGFEEAWAKFYEAHKNDGY